MDINGSYNGEYIAEVNSIFNAVELKDSMYDLLYPLRMYLTRQNDMLPYALCRFSGGDTKLSLMADWYYQVSQLNYDKTKLVDENRQFFYEKFAPQIKENKNLKTYIKEDILNRYLRLQQRFISDTVCELKYEQLSKHPQLKKYLCKSFLTQTMNAKLQIQEAFYTREISPESFVYMLKYGEGFRIITFPLIIGFAVKYGRASSVVWSRVEEVLGDISTLYELTRHQTFKFYYYVHKQNMTNLTGWYIASHEYRSTKVSQDENTIKYTQELINQYKEKAMKNLHALDFPNDDKGMLHDLIEWASEPVS